ncbi:aa3-type cytochrome c oxidase subunit IV [Sneathiella limimaris]|nr:aa3-type cytochrome c oxidase subunit IV [Sneathiella limimaris]
MYEQGNMNVEQQKESYNAFVKLFTWGTIISAVITAFVVYIIT